MKIKDMKLTKEEKQILKDVESGKYISEGIIEEERKRLQLIAQNTIQLRKTKNVNIRIREDDLNKLRAKAQASGIPYQTMISVLIRQYTSDKLQIQI
ncbi:hypothetical protein AUK04_04120 [Candidatus Roizmanbacteria bacterium CG2_30_33_16]|uniref:Antitoxin n=5 Tax=Candidatus Roizmaniibacteriota TaxID=1752723 RepID=A0A2M7E4E5_9BACT|nr:MAG: hypothetical protein AUK04_04120 [Candidatus Roizmanbacteria bacterium CG2_30_33_16]PIV62602.1 MAG: hypothetical protein COS12_01815 [Candidatus Roizmanbacteria bacterium CG01_land_8_20_14_3_00_33_9]PJB88752.1 MAG: hypothetical protein CO083_01845 [Candidatus Roizmanbacteria bacterium CG_4_9_14_0_8_um_filter_34_12]